jgi:RND family efflux transporter MFP subunit
LALAGIGFLFYTGRLPIRLPSQQAAAPADSGTQAPGEQTPGARARGTRAPGDQSPYAQSPGAQAPGGQANGVVTTTVRPASEVARVSAAGNIGLADQRPVALAVAGTVVSVTVQAGDRVAAGDVLLALDTTDLQRAVRQAELNMEASQAALDKLMQPADALQLAAAQATLVSAQENLAKVTAGPSQAQLAAAQANLASAQDKYQTLKAGPTDNDLAQMSAAMLKAQEVVVQAQGAYNKIAYKGDISMSAEAKALQDATIDYEAAKAAFEVAAQPAAVADLQAALSAVQTAQDALDTLKAQPTAADLAGAQAQLVSAAYSLRQLQSGASAADVRATKISVEQAQLNVDVAKAQLAQAVLRAPIGGTILAVSVSVGQNVSAGTQAAAMADLSGLELTINVAEVDVSRVLPGQPAQVSIDAMPGRSFNGVIDRITPASTATQGVVNYPVTVRLTDADLAGVRPGMTAVASLMDEQASAGWLVPENALQQGQDGAVVQVVRGSQLALVPVTVGAAFGEWRVVEAADLHAGDAVVGDVTSYLAQQNMRGGPGPGMMGVPLGGGGGGGFRPRD